MSKGDNRAFDAPARGNVPGKFNRGLIARLSAMTALGGSLILSPAVAWAQSTSQGAAATPQQANGSADQSGGAEIVVTGSLLRQTSNATPSPVTVLSARTLEERGVNTVTQALQTLSSNNAGTMTNGWNAGGNNFASGASGISLRGLDTSYTLVLINGLRTAFFPYADDGTRNFVDTNTIPDAIVDRVEVLRDGASSTYGADAVAGVVNIITKRQIEGLHLNGSGGVSQRGDSGEQRVDATWGYGDLDSQRFNFYVSGEYQHNDPLYARDRGYPFNTADQSRICGTSNGMNTTSTNAAGGLLYPAGSVVCRTNGIANGIQANGTYGGVQATLVPFVRPYVAPGAGGNPILGNSTAVAGSRYQMLNPALGCQGLPSVTLTAAQRVNGGGSSGAAAPAVVCQQDATARSLALEPELERIGASAHLTLKIGSNAQAYIEGNYYQSMQDTTALNYATNSSGFRTAAGGQQVVINTVTLPVYVCARSTTGACTAANGTLNPNNPFAANGQLARILYRFPDYSVHEISRTYRVAAGISGSFAGNWNYALDGIYSRINARLTYKGVVHVGHFLDEVRDGSFNFVDPNANSASVWNYLMPTNSVPSHSEVDQIQASLSHAFFDLPGGPLQVAVGGSVRFERDLWNSSNPVDPSDPTNRYTAIINAVGADGRRWVDSGYFELSVPLVKQFEVNASGRYDHYSSGQNAFSPKIGAKFTPIPELALRATWSRGFRIPSFNEAFGLPTTGYVGHQVTGSTPGSAAYYAAHGSDSYATAAYTYGLTSLGNPNLEPERSRNITAGAVFQPVRWLTLTADYYNIKISNLITPADTSQVLTAYYANNGVVNIPGITVLPGTPDPNFPNALPQIGFIESSFQNANFSRTAGLDMTAEVRIPLGGGLRWISNLEATRIFYLDQNIGGTVFKYAGTLSPCGITSCSGTPKWRGVWQNTLDFAGKGSLSATAYYTSGYSEASVDSGGDPNDCIASEGASVAVYADTTTPVLCRQRRFISVDLTGTVKVNSRFSLYANVLNVFDAKPPYDPGAAYGAYNYNPAFAETGMVGRYIRIGARVDF